MSKSDEQYENIRNVCKVGVISAETAVKAAVSMCRAFNQEKSKMKKVRPMVDKDLRDYVLSKFDNKYSFNKSARILLASQGDKIKTQAHKIINLEQSVDSLKSRNDVLSQARQDFQVTANRRLRERNEALNQEIAKLHNQKAKLEKWSSDVAQHNASLMEEIAGDLYSGAVIGLFIGLSIGYLFL